MRFILVCALLSSCISLYARPDVQDIKKSNPSKFQIVFEVEKQPDIDPDVWQYLMDCVLELYTPSLTSDDQLDDWMTRFNDMIKKVAYVSVKTHKTHGKLTFRFVTN